MLIRVSSPGVELPQSKIDEIERDLEKIDRRLQDWKEVFAEVRVTNGNPATGNHVVIELEYGRNHLIAKADNKDLGQAVREAREEMLRQINDRSKRGHSSFVKKVLRR
jgi:ribosome-associated translation inhibitor RaiA